MFDGLFELIAQVLSFFYDLVPNYAISIAMLTLIVMVVTTPFTLKGTRSMIQMQRLQPEMRRLRSEEHTSELQSLMRISYAVFCLKQKINMNNITKQYKHITSQHKTN